MALQSSGAISMSQIRNEWGSSYSLGSYYRGSLPSGRTNYGNIPSSGAISFSNFYGTNAASSNWTSTIGVASFTVSKMQNYGYQRTIFQGGTPVVNGTLSDKTINPYSNREISIIAWQASGHVNFGVFGNVSNSGWTRIKVGSTNFYRSSSSFIGYNSNYNRTNWQWASSSNPFGTSGNKTLTFIV